MTRKLLKGDSRICILPHRFDIFSTRKQDVLWAKVFGKDDENKETLNADNSSQFNVENADLALVNVTIVPMQKELQKLDHVRKGRWAIVIVK